MAFTPAQTGARPGVGLRLPAAWPAQSGVQAGPGREHGRVHCNDGAATADGEIDGERGRGERERARGAQGGPGYQAGGLNK